MKASLYFHTIRHLRLAQIVWRIRYKLQRPRPNLQAPPSRRALTGEWVRPCEHKQSMFSENGFTFLNESRTVVTSASWNDPAVEKLWLYNLHYFDDLNAEGARDRSEWHMRLIERWIDENPPGYGNGWEPYPSSLRIVNWIKSALGGGELSLRAVASLAVQVRFLCERLEFHLLGNHLLANAKALVFAGLFFEGEESAKWLKLGLTILRRELPEQILDDGAHFELSPMYHSIILEDLLDIENIGHACAAEEIVKAEMIEKMQDWLAAMCHPDGEISFFNDAAKGIVPSPSELHGYAGRLKHTIRKSTHAGVQQLAASGYVRLQNSSAVLLIDAAPVGPSYLPGHAHADTLSFELSLRVHRLIVNSGTSCYGSGPERQRQRGTAAHNTLVIDDQDSSEVWGGFRVARRAQVQTPEISETMDGVRIKASHDGYLRLPGRNLHERNWVLGEGRLDIEDEITGRFHHAEVRFHLHPNIKVIESNTNRAVLNMTGVGIIEVGIQGGSMAIEQTTWHPHFGVSLPNQCLVARLSGSAIKTRIQWGAGV